MTCTKTLTLAALVLFAHPVLAEGREVYHAFRLEAGAGGTSDGHGAAHWKLDGWIGTDEDKLWLKSEGEREDGKTHRAEFWALYSRAVSTFWDAQIGARHDTRPGSTSYGVIGISGLAPYFVESGAHGFVSEDGDVSARLHLESDLLLTQRLIAQPYLEANISAQDVPELDTGAGLSRAEIGVQTRYQVTPAFAPYIDARYERAFGETVSIARRHGEEDDAVIATLGLRLLF